MSAAETGASHFFSGVYSCYRGRILQGRKRPDRRKVLYYQGIFFLPEQFASFGKLRADWEKDVESEASGAVWENIFVTRFGACYLCQCLRAMLANNSLSQGLTSDAKHLIKRLKRNLSWGTWLVVVSDAPPKAVSSLSVYIQFVVMSPGNSPRRWSIEGSL